MVPVAPSLPFDHLPLRLCPACRFGRRGYCCVCRQVGSRVIVNEDIAFSAYLILDNRSAAFRFYRNKLEFVLTGCKTTQKTRIVRHDSAVYPVGIPGIACSQFDIPLGDRVTVVVFYRKGVGNQLPLRVKGDIRVERQKIACILGGSRAGRGGIPSVKRVAGLA